MGRLCCTTKRLSQTRRLSRHHQPPSTTISHHHPLSTTNSHHQVPSPTITPIAPANQRKQAPRTTIANNHHHEWCTTTRSTQTPTVESILSSCLRGHTTHTHIENRFLEGGSQKGFAEGLKGGVLRWIEGMGVFSRVLGRGSQEGAEPLLDHPGP